MTLIQKTQNSDTALHSVIARKNRMQRHPANKQNTYFILITPRQIHLYEEKSGA